MITCFLCGDVEGPWAYEDGIGFVCEDCIENGTLEQYKKEQKADA